MVNIYDISKEIKIDEKAYLYKNPYALNIGFSISDDFEKKYIKDSGTRLDNLNNFFKALTGIQDDVLIKIPYIESNGFRKYDLNKNKEDLYMIFDYKISTNFSKHGIISINDKEMILNDFNNGINHIHLSSKDKELLTKVTENIDINSYDFYYFNEDVFKLAINKLKEHQLKNVKITGNKMSADIDLDKDSLVMITIPYDKGWNVYVDGKNVKYGEIADTFIGINIPKGNHKIHMVFYPRGMIIGIIISFINLLLTIFYLKNVSKSLNINKN